MPEHFITTVVLILIPFLIFVACLIPPSLSGLIPMAVVADALKCLNNKLRHPDPERQARLAFNKLSRAKVKKSTPLADFISPLKTINDYLLTIKSQPQRQKFRAEHKFAIKQLDDLKQRVGYRSEELAREIERFENLQSADQMMIKFLSSVNEMTSSTDQPESEYYNRVGNLIKFTESERFRRNQSLQTSSSQDQSSQRSPVSTTDENTTSPLHTACSEEFPDRPFSRRTPVDNVTSRVETAKPIPIIPSVQCSKTPATSATTTLKRGKSVGSPQAVSSRTARSTIGRRSSAVSVRGPAVHPFDLEKVLQRRGALPAVAPSAAKVVLSTVEEFVDVDPVTVTEKRSIDPSVVRETVSAAVLPVAPPPPPPLLGFTEPAPARPSQLALLPPTRPLPSLFGSSTNVPRTLALPLKAPPPAPPLPSGFQIRSPLACTPRSTSTPPKCSSTASTSGPPPAPPLPPISSSSAKQPPPPPPLPPNFLSKSKTSNPPPSPAGGPPPPPPPPPPSIGFMQAPPPSNCLEYEKRVSTVRCRWTKVPEHKTKNTMFEQLYASKLDDFTISQLASDFQENEQKNASQRPVGTPSPSLTSLSMFISPQIFLNMDITLKIYQGSIDDLFDAVIEGKNTGNLNMDFLNNLLAVLPKKEDVASIQFQQKITQKDRAYYCCYLLQKNDVFRTFARFRVDQYEVKSAIDSVQKSINNYLSEINKIRSYDELWKIVVARVLQVCNFLNQGTPLWGSAAFTFEELDRLLRVKNASGTTIQAWLFKHAADFKNACKELETLDLDSTFTTVDPEEFSARIEKLQATLNNTVSYIKEEAIEMKRHCKTVLEDEIRNSETRKICEDAVDHDSFDLENILAPISDPSTKQKCIQILKNRLNVHALEGEVDKLRSEIAKVSELLDKLNSAIKEAQTFFFMASKKPKDLCSTMVTTLAALREASRPAATANEVSGMALYGRHSMPHIPMYR